MALMRFRTRAPALQIASSW